MRIDRLAIQHAILFTCLVSSSLAQDAPPPIDVLDIQPIAENSETIPEFPISTAALPGDACVTSFPYSMSQNAAGWNSSGAQGSQAKHQGGRGKWFYKEPRTWRPPVGESVNSFWMTQISNGTEARMVLYRYDFVDGRPELTSRGLRQLVKFQSLLQNWPHPVTVQPSLTGEALDRQRQTFVLEALSALGTPVPYDRVIIRIPPTRGLDGLDAEPIHSRLLGIYGTGTPPANGGN